MTEPDDELVRLRGQLAEEQQRNKQLEKRIMELIHERSQLYNELHVYRAHRHASELTEELARLASSRPMTRADDESR